MRIPNDFGNSLEEFFMGRIYWDNKNTTDRSKRIPVAFLKKHGYFNSKYGIEAGTVTFSIGERKTGSIGISVASKDNDKHIQFTYTETKTNGEKKECDYKVPLVTTPCNYGGARYWFRCSLVRNGIPCNRRVGVLYLPPGASYFGCRHCYNLTYESRNENRRSPYAILYKTMKAEKIEEGLKRRFYKGKPTKKYRRYLALTSNFWGKTNSKNLLKIIEGE